MQNCGPVKPRSSIGAAQKTYESKRKRKNVAAFLMKLTKLTCGPYWSSTGVHVNVIKNWSVVPETGATLVFVIHNGDVVTNSVTRDNMSLQ